MFFIRLGCSTNRAARWKWARHFSGSLYPGSPLVFWGIRQALGVRFSRHENDSLPFAHPHGCVEYYRRRIVPETLKSSPPKSGEWRAATPADFFTILGHELRTPLTPVLSLVSSSLAEPNLPADVRQSFSLIERNVQNEARLIDDLLDLLRLLDGRFEVQKQLVDLHTCLEAALNVCRGELDARRIAVQFDFEATAPGSLGDALRLPRLFAHLFRKAAQLAPDGANFEVRTSNQRSATVVEIGDASGEVAAVARGELAAALKLRDHTAALARLGMGLLIARQIVEAHGGELQVPTKGALFVVRLPGAVPREAGNPSTTTTIPRGTSILVVEDHEDTRRVLSRALRRRGFAVASASTVESACQQYASQPADLVICDIGLPDGTGWDVLSRLRAAGPVRAIAVSGYGTTNDLEKSEAAGFAAHILKPVDFSGLEATVARVLCAAAEK